jgi:4-hydroxy-tetrahydrodipicolinate reductase
MTGAAPTRVVQWATGNVGRSALRAILARPSLELAGLYVTSPAKAGRDAGELAGVGPTGVAATSDLDEILALDADVVVHTPLPSLVHGDDPGRDVDDFCALLASGADVITTVGYMYPAAYGNELTDRLTEACDHGGSSFHGTGANPGWFGDVLPLVMSGLSLEVDRIAVQEISSFQHYPSPEIMFDMMGFGTTPDEFARRADRHRAWLDGLFREAVMMVAHGLGLPVATSDVTSTMVTTLAERDLDTAAGLVPAGTVAGQRWHWIAESDGRIVVEQETVWRMHGDVAPEWPEGDWSITIEGNPRMHLSLPHRWNRDVLGSTAAHAVNAIPYVVGAEPGIVTFLDLPIITARA